MNSLQILQKKNLVNFILPPDQRIEYQHCQPLPKKCDNDVCQNSPSIVKITKLYAQELATIADRDPLHEITEQEKDLIWKVREDVSTLHPGLLPRIIDCVDYANASQVAELHNGLLDNWPALSPENSLQLLDYAYPDEHVRRFAVRD